MRRSIGLLAAAALVAAVAGCGGGSAPRFERAADWHLLSAHGELAAANVPFARADRSLASPPSRTVDTLPRRGVVIFALVSRNGSGPRSPLPLRLGEAARSNPFEGFRCAPAVPLSRCFAASGSVRRLAGRLDGYDVDLWVFLGTDRPGSAQIEAVDTELPRLRV
jgi:ABC-type amino acid transport substrate-binding protein